LARPAKFVVTLGCGEGAPGFIPSTVRDVDDGYLRTTGSAVLGAIRAALA